MQRPIWEPSAARVADTNLTRFIRETSSEWNRALLSYADLHDFSVDHPEQFWASVWRFSAVIATRRGDRVAVDLDRMPGARFFPDARLNFAENLLRRRDGTDALVFWGEDRIRRTMSAADLYEQVSQVARALRDIGVQPGDRVAGYMPNMPETVVATLASASIGAVWSSCSPDFGAAGVVDRFGQIAPKVLISADGYFYNGQVHDRLTQLKTIVAAMPSVDRLIIVPYTKPDPSLDDLPNAVLWPELLARYDGGAIEFTQLPFDHPLYIMYSSGTTGPPKCIVHGLGGTLLQHLKEHQLHCDIRAGDHVFYFTTCGWMMWNWLISALASNATLLLYDGSPFYPNGNVLFDFADATGMTLFGTSATFINAVNKAGLAPIRTHRLASVRTMTSTGSPLSPESFDFVYERIKSDMHLASVSGGTDILSCFVGGNPIGPVWRGEIQVRVLGMKVDVFDSAGRSVPGRKGELVCTAPFPSMPIAFWNDPTGDKYRAAYFDKFPGVWCHGDFAELTDHGGMIIYGRSDAILNPGGVRIGTAELYRQVEQLDEVLESLAIGQQWAGDVRIVLFVRLRDELKLDDALVAKIQTHIRQHTTPRHATCQRGSFRWPTSHGRRAGRSSRSPCAMSCTAGPSRTATRWPTPKRSSYYLERLIDDITRPRIARLGR